MPSQEQALQSTLLDLLLEPRAGEVFEESPEGFGAQRGLLPTHTAALDRFKDRLLIYRGSTRNGIEDVLEHFFPVTKAQLQGGGTWDECVSDFMSSRTITTPFFRDIMPTFIEWLAATSWGQPQWPSLLPVAHFELLEFLVERWPDSPKMDGLQGRAGLGSRIVLDPATRIVQYAYAVHLATTEQPFPEAKPVHLLAYRDDQAESHILEITDSTAALMVRGQEVALGEAMASLGIGDLTGALRLLQDLFDQGALWGFQTV